MAERTLDQLREQAAKAHRILAMTGSMNDTTGHVLVRIPGTNEFLARGRNATDWSPRYVRPEAMRKVDLDGNRTEDWADYSPPPERFIGAEIFRKRPEINVAIHAHPPAQVLCGNLGVPLRPIVGSQNWGGSFIAAKGVPVYPRAVLIHSPALWRAVAGTIGNRDAALLKQHGNVVVGRSIEEATVRAIQLENLARMTWQIRLTGKTPPNIPFADIEDMTALGIQPRALGGGPEWTWHYYEQMLDHRGTIDAEIEE